MSSTCCKPAKELGQWCRATLNLPPSGEYAGQVESLSADIPCHPDENPRFERCCPSKPAERARPGARQRPQPERHEGDRAQRRAPAILTRRLLGACPTPRTRCPTASLDGCKPRGGAIRASSSNVFRPETERANPPYIFLDDIRVGAKGSILASEQRRLRGLTSRCCPAKPGHRGRMAAGFGLRDGKFQSKSMGDASTSAG